MKKRNLILASFIILLAILTGACSTQERSIPVQEADVALAENPVPKPDAAQAEIVNPIQSTGITSYLFAPIRSTTTYLMDAEGNALQTWESAYTPGNAVYLQENGNLLRTGSVKSTKFGVGGTGGIIEEIASDGSVVWAYQYANDQVQQHHDIEQMPNGNILMIAWGLKSQADAIAAGRDPSLLSDGELWPDHVIELNPTTNTIVWEWHVWDHLVQDYDASKANYGTVSEHPGLVDINFVARKADADWNHTNSIDYNAELDQILLSVHSFSEIWIIDHDTTTKTATGTAGDLLYRWGNPQTYDAGSSGDQQFYTQHDAQWIAAGMPGAGNILVFNNGDRQTRAYSSVDEIVPPLNADGGYSLSGAAYTPAAPVWTYVADTPSDFYADHISGAQRLSNGNTLICSGTDGSFFEVTSAGEVIWRYDYGANVFRVIRYESDYAGLQFLDTQPTTSTNAGLPVDNAAGGGQPANALGQNNSQQGNRPRLDLASAASTLGVTEEALRKALGTPPPDFAAIAAQLGITEQALIDALGIPTGGPPNSGG
ncbi:MAG: arylsulfotransferase (ASST) [Anaerolineae bacterium]|jgi:hypothetical protein|nr:arylsulfotransferase (ASST) [Anaerolineae bacterium]MBT3714486.1 arylsulfotransferase (ASST) [Anaerolineae bacterium]MBT4312703.1 arylsulfotransferase (ASST) [Anaerolineae bacterium]MBT4458566.1 arylsulfotransferase (ASST) [Anaerolineae bacterium]MBT4843380.1 arylsulfotransferase (ASST) [Anaerolineae bacterium]